MLILKIIVVILSIFILSIWGKFIVERVQAGIELKEDYEKGQYIYDIVDKAYSKLDEITSSNNYSLIEESISVSHDFKCVYDYLKTEKYYKDGYFKKVSIDNPGSIKPVRYIDVNYVDYGVRTKDKDFCIQLNDNNYIYGSIATEWAQYENIYGTLEGYRKEDVLEYKDYEIKEEQIDGITYYIISTSQNRDDNIYDYEIWINKESMELAKTVYEKRGCNKTETKFTFTVNNVKDEEVRVKFAGNNEKLQELDKLFEKIANGEFEDDYVEVIKWSDINWETKIPFDNYVKPNKKIIMEEEAWEIIGSKYKMEAGYGYGYEGIIFDQNGNAYYAYRKSRSEGKENEFVQNIFVSIFGDIVKTNDIDKELKNGETVIL